MRNIRTLNISAARLLVALYECGESFNDLPIEQQLEIAGLPKRKALHDARKALETTGFIRVDRPAGLKARIHLLLPSFLSSAERGGAVVDNVLYSNSNVQHSENGHHKPDHTVLAPLVVAPSRGVGTIEVAPPRVPTQNSYTVHEAAQSQVSEDTSSLGGSYPEGSQSLLDRCRVADAMDETGELLQRNSPAQQRRKAQVPLIQEAWAALFPHDHALTPENARLFLSYNEDSAVEVLMELEERVRTKPELAQKGNSPLAYFRVRFKNRKAERATKLRGASTGQSSPLSSAVPVRPGEPAPDPRVWDGELMEPGAAWMQKREAARQAAQRIWKEA